MVKKVVAAAAAASGLVLAGAGLAVADSGKQAPVTSVGSDAGFGRVSGHNPKCVDSSTNVNGRLPHASQTHPQGPQRHHPGPGENHGRPHAPEGPKDHNNAHPPHHQGHPQHHAPARPGQPGPQVPSRPGGGTAGHHGAPESRPFPGELARTGSSEELRLMLAGSTGLMLAGAVVMRRTRRQR